MPAETIVAVWGVESNFGDISGKYPLLQALGTLSCEGRRQSYFRGEFFTTMKLLQRGDVYENQLKGSWAGLLVILSLCHRLMMSWRLILMGMVVVI